MRQGRGWSHGWSIGLLVLLAACGRPPQIRDDSMLPFVFRSLDLRQQDQRGKPAWELTSPEARYDLRRRVARALRPRGVIYQDGKPLYRLEAASGTVLNDGEVILLEGGIRVQQLGPQPVLIRAKTVRWLPSRQRMEFDRDPEALDRHSRLASERATFLIDRNRLELRGKPRLERWQKSFDPFLNLPRGTAEVVMKVSEADWEPRSGILDARGPVVADRRPPGSKPPQPPQTATGRALQGNTQAQEYLLKGPTSFLDPAQATSLQAGDVSFALKPRIISTASPFSGRRGALEVSGRSLQVDGARETAVIPSGCSIRQKGESLSGESCTWNWTTQEVTAQGALELRRSANQQVTRGTRLSGRLGDQGSVEITAPGGRVVSQFVVPRRQGPPPKERPRPVPPPIRP